MGSLGVDVDAIALLPVAEGPVTFQVTGDLTIKRTTKPVTFELVVTPVTETRLEGLAHTLIDYAQFEIVIPPATGVASVDEMVRLELQFVATAVSGDNATN